jgi:purine-binding chemotaxis protein CheW
MEKQILVFIVGSEYFAIHNALVESIIPMQPITKMPGAPQLLDGIIEVRGKPLPVIDLRKRLGMHISASDYHSRIIVTGMKGLAVGMIVDGVLEVMAVPPNAIETDPSLTHGLDASLIEGVVRQRQHRIGLLNLEAVLSPQAGPDLAPAGM